MGKRREDQLTLLQASHVDRAGCGKTILIRGNFDGLHVSDKPALSDYLVRLVSLMQPNKPDRPNRPNEQDSLLGLLDWLLEQCLTALSVEDKLYRAFCWVTCPCQGF